MSKKLHSVLLLAFLLLSAKGLQAQSPTPTPTPTEELARRLIAATDEERAAFPLAQANGAVVRALIRQAGQLNNQGEPEKALSALNYALGLAVKLNDPAGQARAHIGLGQLFYGQGDYPQALAAYGQALPLADAAGDKVAASQAWGGTGIIQRNRGDYVTAQASLEKALVLSRAAGDVALEASQLNSIGNIYLNQGDLVRAEEFYSQSLAIRERIQDKGGMANALQNLAVLNAERARYSAALGYYQKALALRTELKMVAGIADSLTGIGQVYRFQGNYRQALDFFQRTIPLREQTRDKAGMSLSLNNIGAVYTDLDDYPASLRYFLKALALREELGDKQNMALLLGNIASSYDELGQTAEAIAAGEKGLALFDALGAKRGTANLLVNMGEIYFKGKQPAKAWQAVEKSVALARENGYTGVLWKALDGLATLQMKRKQYGPAQEALREAIGIIEDIRAQSFGTEQERQNFFDKKVIPYQNMAGALHLQGKDAEALAYAERAKSRVLLDVLQSGRADINKAMSAAELEQEKQLTAALAQANGEFARASRNSALTPAERQELENSQQTARYNLAAFETALYVAHPALKVKRGQSPPLTLAQTAELLPDSGTALLEFVVAEEETLLFVLTQDAKDASKPALRAFRLDLPAKILAARAEQLRQKLARRDLGFQAQARELFDQLLKPAQSVLAGKKALIIVPDGGLWNLPFQALQSANGRYLAQDYAVSYAPSLTVLREMRRARQEKQPVKGAESTLLAFGNPSLPAAGRGGAQLMSDDLAALPEAERQVQELAQLYGPRRSRTYLNADATEARAKAEAGRYRVLQFATHGVLNDASPLNSYVLLAPGDAAGNEDGLLEAREMMDLQLNADLVILSACETARGQANAGEGVIGMTWALFVAGAPATVASQWKVESSSTTELMLEFHRNLQNKKISATQALHQAQEKLLRSPNYRHPFYWAGFVLIGDEK